ncbi:MAG: head maturation protease, ClpP-related [Undibacterium sp.]
MNLIEITNKAGKVKLDGVIHEGTMEALIDRMATLYGDDAVRNELRIGDAVAVASDSLESLEIEINSPGGSIKQGYRAYKTIMELRERGVYVTARITKLAASMGSILAVAADKVIIEENARIMIHEAATMAWGNAQEMKSASEMLDAVSNELAAIYAGRMGVTVAEARALMIKETWMDAKQAVALKLADEIYTKDKSIEKPKSKLDRILDGEEKKTVDIADAEPTSRDMSFIARLTNPSDTEAQERIVALEASISQHDQVVADYEAKLAIAESALAEVEVVRAENVSLTAQVATIPDLEASIAQLTEKAEITETKIGEAAAQLLAAQGHGAPVDLSGTAVAEGEKQNLLEQYASLSGVEKREFLAKHAAELRQLEREKP